LFIKVNTTKGSIMHFEASMNATNPFNTNRTFRWLRPVNKTQKGLLICC